MASRHWKETDPGVSRNTQYGNNALADVQDPVLMETMARIFRAENFVASAFVASVEAG